MQPAPSTRIPDGFLAAMRLEGEKPHQGLPSRNPAPNPVREVCKFTVLLGMRGQAELNRAGSCCTGKERDTESGNDYFGARYYASSMGRWMSPDWNEKVEPVPYSKLDDPQTLNLYTYVLNNPLVLADADGHTTDTYVPDIDKHGGAHIDRYTKGGQNVGRYRPDGTPIKFKGKTPGPVPNADKGKFGEAAAEIEKKQQARQQEQNLEENPPPVPAPPTPDGLKPDPPSPFPFIPGCYWCPNQGPDPSPKPMPFPGPAPGPIPLPEPTPFPIPEPIPVPTWVPIWAANHPNNVQ
jgi:RHS repeat-associated protein